MGGGLMQLVAYGAQDIYLTGNPQITFFKVVYRRHTNFSCETIMQVLDGASTTAGGNGSLTVARNGDLLSRVYVVANDSGITSGDKIINTVEVEIGGQRVDKHTREWMQVWNELSTNASKSKAFKSMTGCIGSSGTTGVANQVQVPLQFWFCRNPGLALPLIALQYHEVKLKFAWGTSSEVGTTANCEVWCEYVYLDTDERRRFAQISHEYLIEQLQYQTEGAAANSYTLNFNHPVKELVWTNVPANVTTQKAKLQLNGHDRFAEQFPEYFQLRQPMDHHTAVPRQNLPTSALGEDRTTLRNILTTAAVAEDRTATVSGSGKMEVTKVNLTTVASDGTLDGAVTSADADTTNDGVADIGYLFHEADLTGLADLSVGDVVEVEVTGTKSVANHATNTSRVLTTVRSKTLSASLANYTGTLLQFDHLLIEANSGEVTTDLTVNSITKITDQQSRTSTMTNHVNVYSFALQPEEHQPSGTCNFSRIDNATLKFSASATVANIYAVNYNVLRVMSGMGGLAYSN